MSGGVFDKKVVFVTGKGGTGKSTIAMAVALVASRRNRRTLLAELDMSRPVTRAFFGKTASFLPTPVAEGVDAVNITFFEALHLYLTQTISIGAVVSRILKNRIVRRFLYATPFSRELVFLNTIYHYYQGGGKEGDRTGAYDIIVVDMPASGHAIPILTVPNNVFRLFQKGPLLKRAKELHTFLTGDDVSVVLVTLGEEMSVTETVETWERLRDSVSIQVGPVIANRLPRAGLTGREAARVSDWLRRLRPDAPPRVRFSLWLSSSLADMAHRAEFQLERLVRAVGTAPVRISEMLEEPGVSVAARVADVLEQTL